MPKSDDVKKLIKFDLFIRRYELVHRRVRDEMLSLVRSPSISGSRVCTDFPEALQQRPPSYHGPYDSGMYKKARNTGSVKRQEESKNQERFGPHPIIVQQLQYVGITIIQGLC